MMTGQTHSFLAEVLPIDAEIGEVAWSVVDATGTSTIDENGTLTAGNPGKVWIVASTLDGSGISDTLSLTVLSTTVLVSDISIIAEGGESVVDEGNTIQFTASIMPLNATNSKVTWSVINGTGTASICDCAILTAISEGTVNVVATAQDDSGLSSIFEVSILGLPSLINEGNEAAFLLYPNPSAGKLFLDVGELNLIAIKVVSLAGTMVLEMVTEPGERIIELDLSDQKPGVFFILSTTEEGTYCKRFIISR